MLSPLAVRWQNATDRLRGEGVPAFMVVRHPRALTQLPICSHHIFRNPTHMGDAAAPAIGRND